MSNLEPINTVFVIRTNYFCPYMSTFYIRHTRTRVYAYIEL